ETSFLLNEMLENSSWRLRLKLAMNIERFNVTDQRDIIEKLKNDNIDEIRIRLSKNLHSLEYISLLEDPCEFVRSSYLLNVIHLISDESILLKLVRDQSWEVKKILLNLKEDKFK